MQSQPTSPDPDADTPVSDSVAAAPPTNDASNPQIADDGDLIEKDWVHKVKHIITTTAQDPYEQSRQFSLLKADYMQKRYGKVIKAKE